MQAECKLLRLPKYFYTRLKPGPLLLVQLSACYVTTQKADLETILRAI
jgi:hypothetical protein